MEDSPIITAVRSGDFDAVSALLLSSSVDNAALTYGVFHRSLLHDAAEYGRTDIVALLLDHGGAEIDAKFRGGMTPLMLAASKGFTACVRLLCERGASVNAMANDGRTPAVLAAKAQHVQTLRYLLSLRRVDVEARKSTTSWTGLMRAARFGSNAVVKVFLEHNANIEATALGEWRPLSLAASSGYTSTVLLLLDHGADMEAETSNGATPLFHAMCSVDTVRALIGCGADVNHRVEGANAVLWAAQRGCSVEPFLRVGCHPNITHGTLGTPLIAAARRGDLANVELLIQHGADPHARDVNGNTAIDVAVGPEVREELDFALCHMWGDHSPPLLEWYCLFQIKRMRSQMDEEEFVDTVPDPIVWNHFADWEGADKWM